MQRNIKPAQFAPDFKQNSAAHSSKIFHGYGTERGTYSLPQYRSWMSQSPLRYQHQHQHQHPYPSSLSLTLSPTPSLLCEQSPVSSTELWNREQVAAGYSEAGKSKQQPNVQKPSPSLLLLISNFEALDAASLESSHRKMQIGKKRLVDYFGGARKAKKEHKDDKLSKGVKELKESNLHAGQPDCQPLPSVQTSLAVNRCRKAVRIGRKKEKDEVVSVEKQETKQNSERRGTKVQERIKFFDGGTDIHTTNDNKIRRASTIANFARNYSNSMSSSALPGKQLTTLQSCPNLRSIHAVALAPLPQTPLRGENTIKESGGGKEREITIDNAYSIDRVHTRGRICERLVQPNLSPPSRIPKPSPGIQCGSNKNQQKCKIGEKTEQLCAKMPKDPERESELVLKKRTPVASGSVGVQILKPVSLEISSPTKKASGIDPMAATNKESRQTKDHPATQQRQVSKVQEKIRLFSHPNVAAIPTRLISIPVRKHRLTLIDTSLQTVSAIKLSSDAGPGNDPLPSPYPEEAPPGTGAIPVPDPASIPSHSPLKPQHPPAPAISKPESKGGVRTQSASQGRMMRISDRIRLFEGFTAPYRGSGKLSLPHPSKGTNEKDPLLEGNTTAEAKLLCSPIPIPGEADASNDADAGNASEEVSQPEKPKTPPPMKAETELAMPVLAGEIELGAAISAALTDLEAPTIAAAAGMAGEGGSLGKGTLNLRSQQERSRRRDRRSRSRSCGGGMVPDGCDGAVDQKTPVGLTAAETGDSMCLEEEKWEGKEKGKESEEGGPVVVLQSEVCLDYQCCELGNYDVTPIAPDVVREIWFRSSVSGEENSSGGLDRGYENEAVLIDTVVAQCELSAPRPRRLTEAVRMVKLCRGWSVGEWKGDREKSGSWGKRMGLISALAGPGGNKEVALLH
jgi:hypothetical protein